MFGVRAPVDYAACLYLAFSGLVALGWGQPSLAGLHAVLILSIVAVRRLNLRTLHDWYPYLTLAWLCKETGWLNSLVWGRYFDDLVLGWEEALFGTSPALWLSGWAPHLWLSEFLHVSYMLWWVLLPALALRLDRKRFESLMWTSFNAFYLCYAFFIFFPVLGPRTLWPPLEPSLQGPAWRLCHFIVARGAAAGAAFPSAHVALALVYTLWARRFLPRRVFWLLLPFTTGAIVCTVYGRFHYVVDVLAGLAVGAASYRWLGPAALERFPVTLLAGGYRKAATGGEVYTREVCSELEARGGRVTYLHVYTLRFLTLVGLLAEPLGSLLLAPVLAFRPGLLLEDEHTAGNLLAVNLLRRLVGAGPTVMIAHHLTRRRAWRFAGVDRVVANSAHTREEILALGVPAEKVVVVKPGFDPRLRRPRTAAEGPLQLLYVGNCSARKGLDVLLRALPGGVRLTVVGSCSGRSPNVRFEGRVSPERLAELYASSHLLVVPSLQEGFSIVVSEALFCGLPVLASDLPALRDRVPAEMRFPPGDERALADALARIDGDRTLLTVPPFQGDDWAAARVRFWEAVREFVPAHAIRESQRIR